MHAWSGIERLEFISKKKTRRAIYSLNNSPKIFDEVMHVHAQVFLVVTHATIYREGIQSHLFYRDVELDHCEYLWGIFSILSIIGKNGASLCAAMMT